MTIYTTNDSGGSSSVAPASRRIARVGLRKRGSLQRSVFTRSGERNGRPILSCGRCCGLLIPIGKDLCKQQQLKTRSAEGNHL